MSDLTFEKFKRAYGLPAGNRAGRTPQDVQRALEQMKQAFMLRPSSYILDGIPVVEDDTIKDKRIYFLNDSYFTCRKEARPPIELANHYAGADPAGPTVANISSLSSMPRSVYPDPGEYSPFTAALNNHFSESMKATLTALNAQILNKEENIMNETACSLGSMPQPIAQEADDRDYQITIQRVNNGFFVGVGCQKFAFETVANLNAAIKLFYENPEKARKKYMRQPEA